MSNSDQSAMEVIQEQIEMPTPMFHQRDKGMAHMLNIQSVAKIDAENIRSNENLTYPTENATTQHVTYLMSKEGFETSYSQMPKSTYQTFNKEDQ